jgi:hypothetical protein
MNKNTIMEPLNLLDASTAQDIKNFMFADKVSLLLKYLIGSPALIVIDYYEISWKQMIAVNGDHEGHPNNCYVIFKFMGVVINDRAYIRPGQVCRREPASKKMIDAVMYNGKFSLLDYWGGGMEIECADIDRLEGVPSVFDINDSMRAVFQWGDFVHGVHSVPLIKYLTIGDGLEPTRFVIIVDEYGGVKNKRVDDLCKTYNCKNPMLGPIVGYLE